MLNRIRRHSVSFKHAFEGLIYTLKSQPNFQFHILATAVVVFLGVYLKVSYFEWLALVFTINTVLVAEMINTSIESVVDLVTLERRQDAKIAKDVSAAMVLVSAILSVVIACFILLPKILILFN